MKRAFVIGWMALAPFAMGAEAPGADRVLEEVKALVDRQEALVAKRVAAEKTPLRKLQMEYLQRQDVAARMAEELRRAVLTEAFSSPEVERLREERATLQARLGELREELVKAGYETEGAKAMKSAMEANARRLEALRATLWPKSGNAPQPAEERKDGQKAE